MRIRYVPNPIEGLGVGLFVIGADNEGERLILKEFVAAYDRDDIELRLDGCSSTRGELGLRGFNFGYRQRPLSSVMAAPPAFRRQPNTAWSATPLARLLAKIHAFVAARLKRRR